MNAQTELAHKNSMDINEIKEYLPHRYPFLLIDRVLEALPHEHLVAIKNVTFNELLFQGHFPHYPVMPGVMIIEAMAQAAGILSFLSVGRKADEKSVNYFAGIDHARFKKPVTPGDTLRFEVKPIFIRKILSKYKGTATVDGQLAAEATLLCALRDL